MGVLWQFCEAAGLAPVLRRGYLTYAVAPNRWRERTHLGDVEAEFVTRTWPEYRRVRTMLGERAILESLLAEVDRDDVVWDVGANVGIYACFLARTLTSGRVVAFEPEPANRTRLVTNLQANASRSRWSIRSAALSDESGWAMLAAEDGRAEGGTPGVGHYYLAGTDDGVPVDCERGDALAGTVVPAPTVVKLDVQGAELKVLQGMSESLTEVETIYLEVHPTKCERYGTSADGVEEFLREAGFSLERLDEVDWVDKEVYYVRASRSAPSR